MIEINLAELREQDKKSIFAGSSKHAVAMSGLDPEITSIVYLAKEGEAIAGALMLELFWGALHIKHLYVSADFRGHSLGGKLIQKAKEVAKEKECPFIYVETMCPQMLQFYQKAGFNLEFTRGGFSRNASQYHLMYKI